MFDEKEELICKKTCKPNSLCISTHETDKCSERNKRLVKSNARIKYDGNKEKKNFRKQSCVLLSEVDFNKSKSCKSYKTKEKILEKYDCSESKDCVWDENVYQDCLRTININLNMGSEARLSTNCENDCACECGCMRD